MEVYLLTSFLIFISGILEIKFNLSDASKFSVYCFLYIIIVFQIGLRWETGTDWENYFRNFENTNDILIVLANSLIGFELGYGLLVYFFKIFSSNYSLFLLFHALVFYLILFKSFKKFSPYFTVTLLFYYSTNLGMVGSNRQLLALAICLMALDFIKDRNWIFFFSIVFIACLFHTSAFLFSIYYFLDRKIDIKYILIGLFASIIIGRTKLPFLIFTEFGGLLGDLASFKTTAYSNSAEVILENLRLSVFGLIKRITLLIIFVLNFNILANKINYYKILFNGYFIGLLFYFLFSNSLIVMVNRGSIYFNIMECMLISCQFLVVNQKQVKLMMFVLIFFISIVFIFQSISLYPHLFDPYKGLFYNRDFNRNEL